MAEIISKELGEAMSKYFDRQLMDLLSEGTTFRVPKAKKLTRREEFLLKIQTVLEDVRNRIWYAMQALKGNYDPYGDDY